ncbi:MAG: bifunctional 3-deoxy-7-phosphoheptulonate synthase/chorismate mutase type II [Bacteroidales bacterium]|nr:bifunctional 3-deoxy-7-phosphoheptulonate synthase/chorismate mutase type II [Bacteroidales bacterium]
MIDHLNITPLSEWEEYNGRPFMIAGPCSAESEQQVMETALELKALGKVDVFRAGIWKPRTRPNSFEGVGSKGLPWMRKVKQETGLPITVEVANAKHVYEALKFGIDMLWIGARTSANPFAVQEIADALKGADISVLIKNPVNPDLDLWIGAMERIHQAGIKKIGMIHRGFSTYEKIKYRNLPQWQIPIELKSRLSEIPLLVDPSHISGRADLVFDVSQKAMDLNFDGLMVETHINPKVALSDAKQQVTPAELGQIIDELVLRDPKPHNNSELNILGDLRQKIDWIDDQLLDLFEQRMEIVKHIGEYKKQNNISVLQNSRWEEIIYSSIEKGSKKGLSREFINNAFKAIHQESINHQMEILNGKKV